jgi:hypothetical protein
MAMAIAWWLIVLEHTTALDFDFLGLLSLNPIHPPMSANLIRMLKIHYASNSCCLVQSGLTATIDISLLLVL